MTTNKRVAVEGECPQCGYSNLSTLSVDYDGPDYVIKAQYCSHCGAEFIEKLEFRLVHQYIENPGEPPRDGPLNGEFIEMSVGDTLEPRICPDLPVPQFVYAISEDDVTDEAKRYTETPLTPEEMGNVINRVHRRVANYAQDVVGEEIEKERNL